MKRGQGRGLNPDNEEDGRVSWQEAENSCPAMGLEFLEVGG